MVQNMSKSDYFGSSHRPSYFRRFSLIKIFVGNLPLSVDHEWLRSTFSNFGRINRVYVSFKPNLFGKKFGFVSFFHRSDAMAAILYMNATKLSGARIKVVFARPRRHFVSGKRFPRKIWVEKKKASVSNNPCILYETKDQEHVKSICLERTISSHNALLKENLVIENSFEEDDNVWRDNSTLIQNRDSITQESQLSGDGIALIQEQINKDTTISISASKIQNRTRRARSKSPTSVAPSSSVLLATSANSTADSLQPAIPAKIDAPLPSIKAAGNLATLPSKSAANQAEILVGESPGKKSQSRADILENKQGEKSNVAIHSSRMTKSVSCPSLNVTSLVQHLKNGMGPPKAHIQLIPSSLQQKVIESGPLNFKMPLGPIDHSHVQLNTAIGPFGIKNLSKNVKIKYRSINQIMEVDAARSLANKS